ncbi:MAG: AraC family transcriptional regulator [Candidatus Delongbacteria bacterium]|nr:AraC family transcriptional regulator [Candidatus Delongbacteria bacterium]MBN2835936.1 AraC family transcriptional regulator [Candidatus Delongbacteria bacterium]
MEIQVEYRKKQAFSFIGKSVKTNDMTKLPFLCGDLWHNFVKEKDKINGINGHFAIGYCEMKCDGKNGEATYYAGLPVDSNINIPEGFEKVDVPKKDYAVFAHKGSLRNLPNTFHYIHSDWIKDSGYILDGDFEFEYYDDDFNSDNPDDDNSIVYVYIPVKRKV